MAVHCTRRKRVFTNPIGDALWEKRQDEATRRIAAEEEARARRETRDGIDLDAYEFKKDDTETYLNLDGTPSRLAMVVKHRVTGRKALVVCELQDGKPTWSVMGCIDEQAPNFLQAVIARTQANGRERLSRAA